MLISGPAQTSPDFFPGRNAPGWLRVLYEVLVVLICISAMLICTAGLILRICVKGNHLRRRMVLADLSQPTSSQVSSMWPSPSSSVSLPQISAVGCSQSPSSSVMPSPLSSTPLLAQVGEGCDAQVPVWGSRT